MLAVQRHLSDLFFAKTKVPQFAATCNIGWVGGYHSILHFLFNRLPSYVFILSMILFFVHTCFSEISKKKLSRFGWYLLGSYRQTKHASRNLGKPPAWHSINMLWVDQRNFASKDLPRWMDTWLITMVGDRVCPLRIGQGRTHSMAENTWKTVHGLYPLGWSSK